MGYCAVGSMSSADWNDIRKMLKKFSAEVDEKFKQLDSSQLKIIKDRITALEQSVDALQVEQDTQNARLDLIESSMFNDEITTSEIIEMYEGTYDKHKDEHDGNH